MLQTNVLHVLALAGLITYILGNPNTSSGAEQQLNCEENNLGIVFVDVLIDGHPMTFMVDSGSTNVAIDRGTSEKLQLNLPINKNIKQPFEIVTCQFDSIGMHQQNSHFEAALIDLGTLTSKSSIPVHGIMGMSFLRNKSLTLSPQYSILVSGGSIESNTRLARCKRDAAGRLYVRVSIGGGHERIETECLVDSGMTGELSINYDCLNKISELAFVEKSASSQLNLSLVGSEAVVQTKTMRRLKTIQVAGVELTDVCTYGSAKSKIGMGLLRRLNCTVHFSENCIEIFETSATVTEKIRNQTPISRLHPGPWDRQAKGNASQD